MFNTIQDFLQTWNTESSSTAKVLDAITDESLKTSIADGHRTMARVAWHITTTIPEMMFYTGLKLNKLLRTDAPVPDTAKAISDAYKAISVALVEKIKQEWTDESLDIEDELYGEKWKRRVTLNALITHEIHHRGQLTVLLRQAGIKVPSIYGPAKEDWHEYGMDEPEI